MKLLGIDLGGTNVRVGLVEHQALTRVESMPITSGGSETDVLDNIHDVLGKFSGVPIDGIGIGVPSVVDVEQGIVYDVQNIPSWKAVPLKKIMEERYRVPVFVNNDANCFAAGEKYFGNATPYQNIVGLIIGTGLGAGLIINNRLYAGKNCGAGEFGNIPYKDHTYEYYCSGQYFTREFGVTGKDVCEKADAGDALALAIFRKYGAQLGEAIKLIMYAVDPEAIILGGSVGKSFRFFQEEMWKTIKDFAYSQSAEKIHIDVSKKENIAILGAAALYLDAHGKE
ncbi:MAG TPA: ROK family protein [Bacteroidota bacterium]|nr:ROK family protein [Bacteroidota bacterium]